MRTLFKSALIVTIFSILTRALGFVLRIVLSRALGAELLGNYQASMSVFGVLMTLVCSGLPLVVSRSVSYKKSLGDDRGAYKSVSAGLCIALFISMAVSLILFAFPQILNVLSLPEQAKEIILFALPGLIASAIYCILRSALWGEKHFFAISFTEFFEQIVRIILCFILFSPAFFPSLTMGVKASLSLSLACIASCVLVIFIYFGLKNKLSLPKGAFKPIIKSSTPITALRTVSSVVSSLIALIIPARLISAGFSPEEAMAQFGMIMGMALPLISIPGTLISSLAVTLVPEISSKTDNIDLPNQNIDRKALRGHIALGLNMSILISSVLVSAFTVLGSPICQILFGSSEAGKYVSAGAFLMLPLGINQISSSMLNSLGLELKSLLNYGIGAIFLFLSIIFLPKYIGTYSLIVGMALMSIISASLNLHMLKKRDLLGGEHKKYFAYCLALIFVSALAGHLIFKLFARFSSLFVSCLVSGSVSVVFMLASYLVFNLANVKGFITFKIGKKKKIARP